MCKKNASVTLVLFLVIALVFMPFSVQAKTFSWSMYGFNASHTFATEEQIPSSFYVDWIYDSGGGVVSTVVPKAHSGRYYIPQASGIISCLDETSGKRLWRTNLSLAPLVSKPVPIGGYLIISSYDGTLFSMFAKNGVVYKKRDLGSRTSTSPVVKNGYIYSITDSGILTKWTINGIFKVDQTDLKTEVKLHTDMVAGNNTIAVTTKDNRIVCFDSTWGKSLPLKWEREIQVTPGANSLCSTEDGILTVDENGILHHMSWKDGKDIWTLPLGEEVLSGIIKDSGHAYLATISGNVHSISISSGVSDWMYRLKEDVTTSNLSISHGKLYVGSNTPARHLHCLTLSAGEYIWHKWFEMPFGCSISTGKEGVLVLPSSGRGMCLSLSNARQLWRCDLGGLSQSSPVVANDQVYFTLTDGSVRSLSTGNGEELWRVNFSAQINSSPAVRGNSIILAPSNKPVHCLDADDGSVIWKAGLYEYINSSPTIYGNTVFIGAWDGQVYSFDLRDGSPRRKLKTLGYITSSPTVTRDGIFVGSHDRFFYKFHKINGNKEWLYPSGRVRKTSSAAGASTYVVSENILSSLSTKKSYSSPNWSVDLDSVIISEPAIGDSDLFVLTSSGNISCRTQADGSIVKWSKYLELDGSYKSVILCKDRLCILTGKSIYILSAKDGEELWGHTFGINISSVVLSNGKLFLTTETGSVHCLSSGENSRHDEPKKLPSVRSTMSPLGKSEAINEAIKQNTTPDLIPVW